MAERYKYEENRDKADKDVRSVENCTVATRFDGGYSWIACLVGFVIQCVVAGQSNSSGVLFMALLDEYKANRAQTAWVPAIASGCCGVFGMVPAVLGNRFGFANVIIFGGLVCAVGLLSSSFAGNIYILYITYGILWGFGYCLCYCSSMMVLPKYFRARIGLANGLVFLGAPAGALILSPVIQKLVSSMGLAKTFRVLAGLQLILVLCGFVTRYILPSQNEQSTLKDNDKKTSFDWSIFKNKGYLTFVGALCLFMPAYLIPYVHLVRLARDSGVDSLKAAFLVSFVAFGSLIVRPFFGKLMDKPGVNRLAVLQLTLLSISVSNTLLPIATNYEWLATFAFLSGFLEGCYVIAQPLIVQDLVGENRLAPALGSLYCFLSIPQTAGPSIAGWIYDTFQSYAVAFFSAGLIATISACLLFIVPLFETDSSSKERVQLLERFESNKEQILAKETRL